MKTKIPEVNKGIVIKRSYFFLISGLKKIKSTISRVVLTSEM